MSYNRTAAYLRQNALLINRANSLKPQTRLMTMTHDEHIEEETLEDVSEMFMEMSYEGGLEHTYRMFNTKTFRDRLNIPTPIWRELEPAIKDKIQEIKNRVKN